MHMPGSATPPGHPSACDGALGHVAFRFLNSVGTRDINSIVAQWLACAFPYRRFADTLAGACARLGADVVRYTFIVVDLHHLLRAGGTGRSMARQVSRRSALASLRSLMRQSLTGHCPNGGVIHWQITAFDYPPPVFNWFCSTFLCGVFSCRTRIIRVSGPDSGYIGPILARSGATVSVRYRTDKEGLHGSTHGERFRVAR